MRIVLGRDILDKGSKGWGACACMLDCLSRASANPGALMDVGARCRVFGSHFMCRCIWEHQHHCI